MIAKIPLIIKICSIFYAQNLEQTLTANAAKIGTYSLITELWLNETQSKLPCITIHHTILTSLHMSGWWNAFRENLQFISQPVLLKTLPLV
jgi:hypothetical protein